MMDLLSQEIQGMIANSSWIRKMFEQGIELKKKYGNDNVYDFSLGNPDLPSPATVGEALRKMADSANDSFAFGYMPNAGYPEVRAALAAKISQEQGVTIPGDRVLVTCGAAGAINVLFRAVLNPGDEVLCNAPYFVEYGFYVGNFGGVLKPVNSKADFSPDVAAIEAAITEKTRAFIINSPNNPTGVIYSKEDVQAIANVLKKKSAEFGRTIYLISDEPYRFLNFDGLEIPSVFACYDASIVIGSFSKSLSLAGERIGYAAVNPALENGASLLAGMIMTNRILGFVNAPAVGQKLLLSCLDSQADLNVYRQRRDLMAKVLDDAGIEYVLPRGAFYFFPKSPLENDTDFVNVLVNERILAVPGRGFGMPGYFRLAFCVSEKTIRDSAESFKRAIAAVKS